MKKKLILLCVLAMLVAGLVVSARADGEVVLTLTPSVSTVATGQGCEDEAGREFTVTASFSGNNDENNAKFWGGNVEIDFDPDVFEYVDGSLAKCAGVPTSENFIVDDFSNDEGYVAITISSTAGYNSGDIFTLKLRAKNSAVDSIDSEIYFNSYGELAYGVSAAGNAFTSATKQSGKVTINHTHGMTKTDGNPHTCTTNGIKDTWACSYCNNTYIDESGTTLRTDENVVDPAAHTFVDDEGESTMVAAVPVTCQQDGNNAYWPCAKCDKVFKNTVVEEVNTPDTSTEGETTVAAETLKQVGHEAKAEMEAKKNATCTEPGMEEHYECKYGCGTILDAGSNLITGDDLTALEIPATNHEGTMSELISGAKPEVKKDAEGNPEKNDDGKVIIIPGYYEHFYCSACHTYFQVKEEEGEKVVDLDNPYGEATFADDDTEKANPIMPDAMLYNKTPGDADDSGDVTSADATVILRYLANEAAIKRGRTPPYTTDCDANVINADVDGADGVSSADVTVILRYLANEAAIKRGRTPPYTTDCVLQ